MFLDRDKNVPIAFPGRTWILLAAVSFVSMLSFVGGWKYGIKYQGLAYVRQCLLISVVLGVSSAALCVVAWKSRHVVANVLAHAFLFYWAATYACPYLGELP
jgi:hypothetical protein